MRNSILGFLFLSTLEHLRLATLVAAHVRPTNYMFFFQFYERRNLAEKLHVEEWSPSVEEVLTISIQLGNLKSNHKSSIKQEIGKRY
ncbi:hypothetical protein MRB53_004198 [Persea americana]|uniref:Uncharacterized protein n=1 Tax=Persea americana TaxID=3435 RepID=A0ACC2MZJ3_PERAE|nr:hypothetical protein MRB53_004198 [Persea americana]